MHPYTHAIVAFVKGEDGPTAVEYAVMLALIIVVCIGAITTLGKNANGGVQRCRPEHGHDEQLKFLSIDSHNSGRNCQWPRFLLKAGLWLLPARARA